MNTEIEISLVETLRSSELYDLVFDVADPLISRIPIFGSLAKLWRGVHSIHAYFYRRKVLAFLKEVSSIPKEVREEQINKMLAGAAEQRKFGEHLTFLLDRMNEIEKATMMGRVARAFIDGRISLDDLKSLNFALDAVDLRMMKTLKGTAASWTESTSQEAAMLAYCGLMTPALNVETTQLEFGSLALGGGEGGSTAMKLFKSAEITYKINRLGRLFVDLCLQ